MAQLQLPVITSAIRRASPELVKVLVPMRQLVQQLTGTDDGRAVRASELVALQRQIDALSRSVTSQAAAPASRVAVSREPDVTGAPTLEPPTFGFLTSLDEAGAVIGREDTDANTGAADSSTWVTVRTFQLASTGTITVRTNAWTPLVLTTTSQAGQIRVLKNSIEVGSATDLTNTSSDEQVWNDIAVDLPDDVFEIQLKAAIQDNGGPADEPSNIDWSEVRASVSFVAWIT